MSNRRRIKNHRRREFDQAVKDNIARVGWHATGVYADREGQASFVYSAGMAEKGLPEVLTFGDPQQFHFVLRSTIERLENGTLPSELGLVEGILTSPPYPVFITEILEENYKGHLNVAMNRAHEYGNEFRALQIIWPDDNGKFPWDAGYNVPAWYQPILGNTPQTKDEQ